MQPRKNCEQGILHHVFKHCQHKFPYLLYPLLCAGIGCPYLHGLDWLVALCWAWFLCSFKECLFLSYNPTICLPCYLFSHWHCPEPDSSFWCLWHSLNMNSGTNFQSNYKSSFGSFHRNNFTPLNIYTYLSMIRSKQRAPSNLLFQLWCAYVFTCPGSPWAWKINLTSQIKFY